MTGNERAWVGIQRSPLGQVAAISMPATALMCALFGPHVALATMSYLFLVCGLIYRRERLVHVRLMVAAIAVDVVLVLVLQVQRSAIQTVVELGLTRWQYLHISASLGAVLTYVPVAFLGWRRYRGRASARQRSLHLSLGVLGFVLRTIGFVFMFTMLK